jgi:hypothetical protein
VASARAGPVRRAGRRALQVAVGLGLALIGRLHAEESLVDRVVRVSLEAEGEAKLEALVEELDADAPASADAHAARYLAWVALAVLTEEEASRDEVRAAAEAAGTSLVSVTSRLASAHVTAGRLAHADGIAALGLEVLAEREPRGLPLLWRVRAEAARLRGDWSAAETHLDEMSTAVDAAELSGSERSWYRALCDVGRAQVALELGRLDRCAMLLASADETARHPDSGALFVAAKLVELDLALMREDPEAVLAAVGAVREDERFAQRKALLTLPTALARIELARQTSARSREPGAELEEARTALDVLLQEPALAPVERFKAQLAIAELELLRGDAERAEDAIQAAEVSVEELPQESHLVVRELLLLPTIRWELARLGRGEQEAARDGAADAFDDLLEQWSQAAEYPDGIGFLELSWRTQVIGAAIESELAGGGEDAAERAFGLVLRVEQLGSLARAAGLTTGLEQLRASLLVEGRGAVVLLPAHFRSHLFLVDGEDVRHWPLEASRKELRLLARTVTDALLDLQPPNSKMLSAALLPAEARAVIAGWDEAYVVGFDLLSDLPFGVLTDEAGEPFGSRIPYAALPSLLFGELLRRRPAPAPVEVDIALLVAQAPDPPDLAFPFDDRERTRLIRPFDSSEVIEHVTPSRALSRERRSARIDHILAHARRLPGRDRATLVLERDPDGQFELGPAQIRKMRVAPLVVLSACASGKGPARIGDDHLASLAGAFLDAGARCVVLARFPVEYEATLSLMEEFGARVARGVPPARALQEAQASQKDERGAFGAAAFEVVGLGHEVLLPRR